jgi:hypothetical protein
MQKCAHSTDAFDAKYLRHVNVYAVGGKKKKKMKNRNVLQN